jgi:hypothetical protein
MKFKENRIKAVALLNKRAAGYLAKLLCGYL